MITATAMDIQKIFTEKGIETDINQIETNLSKLVNLGVPVEDAIKSVIKKIASEKNVELSATSSNNVSIGEIYSIPPKKWVNVKIAVINLGADGNNYKQRGVIGDETGTINFISSNNVPFILEIGKSYLLENVIIGEFRNQPQISVNKSSKASILPETIEAKPFTKIIEGAIVSISDGSGLIKRCPTCKRALSKGACSEHGKIDGTYDLRIKATLDDGENTYTILLQKDLTETLTGIDLNRAIAMAADALDQKVVMEEIEKMIIGRYYRVEVTPVSELMIVKGIDSLTGQMINPLKV
jgi:replication factor A1